MKAKKLYKKLLENIPQKISETILTVESRKLIALVQLENVLELFHNKKKSRIKYFNYLEKQGISFK